MKKKIAITGGIGSGKSTVLHIFGEMGYPIFSCDEIYREIIDTAEYVKKIEMTFPRCVVDGKVDRKLLASTVFGNGEALEKLNAIAHPLIMQRLLEEMKNCTSEKVFAEVPLLFEGNYENLFDQVIVVCRDKAERIQSVVQRDQIPSANVEKRILTQFDYEDEKNKNRLKNCKTIFIQNEGELDLLKNKIKNLKL